MRVWQAGSHLTRERDARVDDWSWKATVRRVSTLARFTAPYKKRTALAIGSLLAATAVSLVPPYLWKLAIDDGVDKQDVQTLWWIGALFVLAGLLTILATSAQTYFTGWTGERILADLRNTLFRHLQRLSLGFYERNRAGVIISRLTNDVEALDQLVTDGFTSLIQNTLTLFGSIVILFFLDWRLALATLIVLPFVSIATALFRKFSARAYRDVRERLGLLTATLAEDIAGMRIVQAFTREREAERNFRQVSEHYRDANQRTVTLNGLYFPAVDFLSAIATAVVLGYGGYLVFGGSMTAGTLFAFVGYLANFFDPVQQLSQLYNTFLSATAALDKIMDVLDEEPELLDKEGAYELPRSTGTFISRWCASATARAPRSFMASSSTCRRGRPSPSSATPGPASRRSRSCSPASTIRARAGSRSTGTTSETSRRSRSGTSSGSSRKKGSSSPGRSRRTSRSGSPTRLRKRSSQPPRRSARTTSFSGSRTATRPSCRSAALGSRSVSAS